MNKELIKLICKILLYIITAVAGFFGVSSLISCASSASVQIRGKTFGSTNSIRIRTRKKDTTTHCIE